jgi:5-(carboxyamino)imidazole ribonucleotide synthase
MKVLAPGATIGILGGGQLGRMLVLAAHAMGYRTAVLDPDRNAPAGVAANRQICAPLHDLDAVAELARQVECITFEFENIPLEIARTAARYGAVYPSPEILSIAQHRVREKSFLAERGYPVTPFRAVTSAAAARQAMQELGGAAILKTAMAGYDGKGQVAVGGVEAIALAWELLATSEAVLEKRVDLAGEFSLIVARRADGQTAVHGPFGNYHREHILSATVWPAALPEAMDRQAQAIAAALARDLELVGLLCIEFFVSSAGEVLINELAPRPHNSGHLTIEAHETSQFSQQIRAICGLPLGATTARRPAAAMANLLGELWAGGEPDWAHALADTGVSLHLYGKQQAARGRKMGHLTVLDTHPGRALRRVLRARQRLTAVRVADEVGGWVG